LARGHILNRSGRPSSPSARPPRNPIRASDFLKHLPLPVVLIVYLLICGLLAYGLKAMDTGLHELIYGYLP